MTDKEPVLLTVLVETTQRRWFVAGVRLSGEPLPLIRSAPGNLDPYVGASVDDQLDFLRHRLSGVLQRGCDRLWGRSMKPRHIVFVADADLDPDHPELTPCVAEHFVAWMSRPPVAFFVSADGFNNDRIPQLQRIAGELNADNHQALVEGLPQLMAAMQDARLWELAPPKTQ